jgi:hypothetical protein
MAVNPVITYVPDISAPSTVDELRFWVQNELRKVAISTGNIEAEIIDLHALILDRMRWADHWVGGLYIRNDVTYDQGWLMIANKDTTDRPAPQAVGAPFPLYTGADPNTFVSAKQVLTGNRYAPTTAGFVLSYRFWVVSGNTYAVYHVENPLGTPIIKLLTLFTATVNGWEVNPINPIIIGPSAVFDMIVLTTEPDPTPATFNGNWNYLVPQNPAPPALGQINHSRGQTGTMSISKTDNDGGDRSAEMAFLTVGDTIDGAGIEWTIQSISDQGTYFVFGVAPAATGSLGVQDFIFETVVPTDIEYLEDVNYWPSSPFVGEVQGIIAIDDDYTNATINDNAYGVDIEAQQGESSDDWDLMARTEI